MLIDTLSALCSQRTRHLLAIAKFLLLVTVTLKSRLEVTQGFFLWHVIGKFSLHGLECDKYTEMKAYDIQRSFKTTNRCRHKLTTAIAL